MSVADGAGGGGNIFPVNTWARIMVAGIAGIGHNNSRATAIRTQQILNQQIEVARYQTRYWAEQERIWRENAPANNPPIHQPSTAQPYVVGSIFYGSKGPRARRGPRKRKRITLDEWLREQRGKPRMGEYDPDYGFVGSPADWLPPVAATTARSSVVAAVMRVLNPALMVLWPSRTASDDVLLPAPEPAPIPNPSGPPRRPRVARRAPTAWPKPDWYNYARPGDGTPAPGPVPLPQPRPDATPAPAERPRPAPLPSEYPRPSALPREQPLPVPVPRPIPRPAPVPSPPAKFPWSDVWPLVVPSMLPRPRAPSVRPPSFSPSSGVDPLTPLQPGTLPFAPPTPTRADPCNRTTTRRKNQCRNPVVSRKTTTRGGVKYLTTTRRLQCRV